MFKADFKIGINNEAVSICFEIQTFTVKRIFNIEYWLINKNFNSQLNI
jgi:hypothetical protein